MSGDRSSRRLERNTDNAKIGGVCAGIADYLDADPTVVRAITIALLLLGPTVVVVYALLWWLLDDAANDPHRFDPPPGADDAPVPQGVDIDLADAAESDDPIDLDDPEVRS